MKILFLYVCFMLSLNAFSMDVPPPLQSDDSNITNIKMIDEHAGRFDIYLVGERHGTAANYKVQLALAKYLNQRQGVRHIFWELGFGSGELINLFLETNNISYVDELLKNCKDTCSYSQNFYKFIQDIYSYNQTLSEDRRMKFVGVDVEHQPFTSIYYLLLLLPNDPPPESISREIEWLKCCKQSPESDFWQSFMIFQASFFGDNNSAYKSYLKDHYIKFSRAVAGIKQELECISREAAPSTVHREISLFNNFYSSLQIENIQKCFGVFGAFHTTLDMEEFRNMAFAMHKSGIEGHNMAGVLNELVPQTKGKVANIELCYRNSSLRNKDGQILQLFHAGWLADKLDAQALGDAHLFNIEAEGEISEGRQFFILVKNSPAVTSFNAEEAELI